MIPTIGFIIGLYVLARYSEMLRYSTKSWEQVVYVFFAMITVYLLYDLYNASTSISMGF